MNDSVPYFRCHLAVSVANRIAAVVTVIALFATTANAVIRDWDAGNGFWSNPGNWDPVGLPADGDDVFIGNRPGVENSMVSLGAIGSVSPETLTIGDGMTLRTNTSAIVAGLRVRVEGSNLVGDGGGIATLYRSTLRLDGLFKANSLLTHFLDIADGGQLVLDDYATAQVFGQMTIDETSTVQGTGSINLTNSGRTVVNDGTIRAGSGQGLTIRQQGLTDGRFDLDGDTGQGRLEVPANRSLTFVGNELNDDFDGRITIDSGASLGMFLSEGWTASPSSVIEATGSILGSPSEINGEHFNAGGTIAIDGLLAQLHITAPATLLPTGNYQVSEGDKISFDGETTVRGGTIQTLSGDPQNGHVEFAGPTGWDGDVNVAGSLVQIGPASVIGPSTVNATTFDMDGLNASPTSWSVGNQMVVNADSISADGNNFFFGSITIGGGFLSKLTINLSDPADHWTMDGTMTLSGVAPFFLERLAGSRVDSFGEVEITGGRVQVSADTRFWSGSLDIGPAEAILRMTGQTLVIHQINVSGQGSLQNGQSGQMTLSHMASLDEVGLVNEGQLSVGIDGAGIAAVDRFESTTSASWLVGIGGHTLGEEFDHLQVTGGAATLDGQLFVEMFDAGGIDFIPMVGDEFTVLTALGGVTGHFQNNPVSFAHGQFFNWVVDYNPNDVTLRLESIAVPEPTTASIILLLVACFAARTTCRSGRRTSQSGMKQAC